MDELLCIIPARGGSKRLPGKNTKQLLGKPLIAWTIESAQKSVYINKIIVSTEDQDIISISENYDINVIRRPACLATDEASTMDVVLHSIDYLVKEQSYHPKYIMLLQCTSPLRTEKHIDEAFEILINNKLEANSLISVTKEKHPFWWLRKITPEGYLKHYIDSNTEKLEGPQCSEELFRPNGSIYLTSAKVFLEHKTFQTDHTMPYIMDEEFAIDIDTEIDFKIAEMLLREKFKY